MRFSLLAAVLLLSLTAHSQTPLATSPPMGWNSWDSYGTTINEKSFRASAAWVAEHLKPAGYEYVTIDEAWFDSDPPADGSRQNSIRYLDANGRYIPAPGRFPSAADGKGFVPLADYIHSLGLKFGIHVLQGVPKEAVAANPLIEGSTFHVKDAANTSAACVWNADNNDLAINPAGQAYYDSIVRLYASWKVDLIKIDCIASRPYKGDEIRMFHEAILKTGRPIVLSLSPGEAPRDEAVNLAHYSQQWRISDDVWDVWQSTNSYPQGINDQFERAAFWIAKQQPDAAGGHWPDFDMLPLGRLGPAPGYLKDRPSRLTPDEQRTMINLWSILRSPLVYGGDPAATDPATLALLTNPEAIAVDQHSTNVAVASLDKDYAIFTSKPAAGSGLNVAVFNRSETPWNTSIPWSKLGLSAGSYRARDLWTHTDSAAESSLTITLAPHASTLVRLTP